MDTPSLVDFAKPQVPTKLQAEDFDPNQTVPTRTVRALSMPAVVMAATKRQSFCWIDVDGEQFQKVMMATPNK
jgi:hypothetical protein